MRHICYFLLLLGVFSGQEAGAQISQDRVADLMQRYDVPGLALVVVAGDSIQFGSRGFADASGHVVVSPDTPFRIASVAKTFSAATAMVEASRGSVDLQADVSGTVPHRGDYRGPVSLHDLLTHTAGYDERYIGYAARTPEDMLPLGEYLRARMPARGRPAGEVVSYSNHGMSLAALVLEEAAHVSFASLAERDVFEPLGMTSTRFLTRKDDIPDEAASPLRCEDGSCTPLPTVFSHAYPAGLAFSTARDMGRFIRALILSRDSGSALMELIPTRFWNDARLPGISYAFFNQTYADISFISHAGSVPGFNALMMVAPDAHFGFFFATNGGSPAFGDALRDDLLLQYIGPWNSRPPTPAVTEDPAFRAGAYEITRYSHDTIERFPVVFSGSIRVVSSGDTLQVIAGGQLESYLQVGEALYERLDGRERLAFGTREGREMLFRSSTVYGADLPAAYERRPWFLAPGFLNEYASWILGAPILLLFLIWPLSTIVGWVARRRLGVRPPLSNPVARLALICAALEGVLFAVFGLGFVARSNRLLESGELFFGMPETLSALAWIPVVHAALAAVLLIAVAFAWRRSWWDRVRRVLFSVSAALAVPQVMFLVHWNYLPIVW